MEDLREYTLSSTALKGWLHGTINSLDGREGFISLFKYYIIDQIDCIYSFCYGPNYAKEST
jgi:hypothetical protein